jgi:hypothetical protein
MDNAAESVKWNDIECFPSRLHPGRKTAGQLFYTHIPPRAFLFSVFCLRPRRKEWIRRANVADSTKKILNKKAANGISILKSQSRHPRCPFPPNFGFTQNGTKYIPEEEF